MENQNSYILALWFGPNRIRKYLYNTKLHKRKFLMKNYIVFIVSEISIFFNWKIKIKILVIF